MSHRPALVARVRSRARIVRTCAMRCPTILMLLLTVIGAGRPAMGQGTAGHFPDPITVREVERWAVQLRLAEEARQGIEAEHEEYRERFAILRDDAIERFLTRTPAPRQGAGLDPREERTKLRSRRAILDQIVQLDNQLLEALRSAAPAGSEISLDRVRLAQERRRARGLLGLMSLPASDLELGAEVDAMELAPEVRAAAAPLTIAYEQHLTRQLNDLAEARLRSALALAEAYEAAGVRGGAGWMGRAGGGEDVEWDAAGDAAGAQRNAEAQERIRAINAEVAAPERRARAEIAAAHREYIALLANVLPEESFRTVRGMLVRRAYRGAVGAELEPRFEDALRRISGDAAQEEAVIALRADYRRQRDRVIDQLMDLIDAQRREMMGVALLLALEDDRNDQARARKGLAEERDRIDEEFAARLATITGIDAGGPATERRVVGRGGVNLDIGAMELADGGGAIAIAVVDGEGVVFAATEAMPTMRGSGPLPPALALEALGAIEAASPQRWPIVTVLHGEYADRYDIASREERDALGELGGGPMMGMRAMVDPAVIERRHVLTRQALERLMAIDALLIADLAAVLSDSPAEAEMAWLPGVREREVLAFGSSGGAGPMMGFGGSREADVDLVRAVNESSISPEVRQSLAPMLRRYADTATGVQRTRYETVCTQQRMIDRQVARMASVSEDGRIEVLMSSDNDAFPEFALAQQRLAGASQTAADFNRGARDEMLATLGERDQRLVRRAYGRAAFPDIYRDAQDIRPRLDRAVVLDGLSDDQLASLLEIVAAHHVAYDDFCDRMVEARSGAVGAGAILGGPPDPETIRAIQNQQNTMRRLRFERSELGAATLRKLASLLTPEQVAAIGGVESAPPPTLPTIEINR